jgi:predicted molibdopterin-dependent oxidoreductase YjgC
MVVRTQTPEVQRIRQTAYKLLIGYHDLDCRNCWKSKGCELLKMAGKVKVKPKTPEAFRDLPTEFAPLDTTNPFVTYDPNRCILCGKCVWVCGQKNEKTFIDFAYRGIETRLTLSADVPALDEKCGVCGECAKICPTAALQPTEALESALGSNEASG